MKNLFSLKNKIIVITGGSGNLGKDFAQTLLEFEAKVAIFDLTDNNENENENIKYFNVDITNKDQIIKNLNKVKSIWGIPSGLINNAGIDSILVGYGYLKDIQVKNKCTYFCESLDEVGSIIY